MPPFEQRDDQSSSPAELVDGLGDTAREVLYVAVGLGVLGARQANITRLAVQRNVAAVRQTLRDNLGGALGPDAG
ncbi:MAG: hypothetical protein S0880_16895 [Actinomycetota bacterium]|nr:hypothetical protein [Actinomycetota bacterium]